MAFQLENGISCIKHCSGVCEQKKNIVNSVYVHEWTAEVEIIASNELILKRVKEMLFTYHFCG